MEGSLLVLLQSKNLLGLGSNTRCARLCAATATTIAHIARAMYKKRLNFAFESRRARRAGVPRLPGQRTALTDAGCELGRALQRCGPPQCTPRWVGSPAQPG